MVPEEIEKIGNRSQRIIDLMSYDPGHPPHRGELLRPAQSFLRLQLRGDVLSDSIETDRNAGFVERCASDGVNPLLLSFRGDGTEFDVVRVLVRDRVLNRLPDALAILGV